MGSMSDALETKLLDYTLRPGAGGYTAPSSIYVGLSTSDPTDAAANECTTGSYARVRITFNAASGNSITGPTATATFPQATASWGTIHGYCLFDASTGGNYLYWGTLASDVTVNANDTVEFASSAISVTLD